MSFVWLQGAGGGPMRERPVDRRAFRDELQRARGLALRPRCCRFSLRTWALLYVKAVSAVLDVPSPATHAILMQLKAGDLMHRV